MLKRPSRQLKTYGRQFTMTRQAFINDDIGMVTTIPMRHAEAADKTINKQVYTGIYNNIAMPDGIKIFDVKHNNVITSGIARHLNLSKQVLNFFSYRKMSLENLVLFSQRLSLFLSVTV